MRNTTTFINLDYLRLMADNDEEMIQTMLGMLVEELPEELEKINTFFQEKNWDELHKVSHKMKSTLAFVGNDDLTAANKEIERLAKEETGPERIGELIGVLHNLAPLVLEELREMAGPI